MTPPGQESSGAISSAQVLAPLQQTEANESASAEQNIMDGIDLMRRTLDACRKWSAFAERERAGEGLAAERSCVR